MRESFTGHGNRRLSNGSRTATVRLTKDGQRMVLSLHDVNQNPCSTTKTLDWSELGISMKGAMRRLRRNWVNGLPFSVCGQIIFN